MNKPLSNELWDQLYPDKFKLLHKLTKTAVEQVEKDQRHDWELHQFLQEMSEAFIAKAQEASAAEKRRQEKAQRRLEHEQRVKEAQERKRQKQEDQATAK
jgi:hypothetical protein